MKDDVTTMPRKPRGLRLKPDLVLDL